VGGWWVGVWVGGVGWCGVVVRWWVGWCGDGRAVGGVGVESVEGLVGGWVGGWLGWSFRYASSQMGGWRARGSPNMLDPVEPRHQQIFIPQAHAPRGASLGECLSLLWGVQHVCGSFEPAINHHSMPERATAPTHIRMIVCQCCGSLGD
jgi:hypothetical protein